MALYPFIYLFTYYSCSNNIFEFHLCYFLLQGELIESSSDEEESGLQEEKQSGTMLDMEDLGNIMNLVNKTKVCSTYWHKKSTFSSVWPALLRTLCISNLHLHLNSVCQVRSKCVITEGTVADGLTDMRPSEGEKRKLV